MDARASFPTLFWALLTLVNGIGFKKKCTPYYDVFVKTVYETHYDSRCSVHYERSCETYYDEIFDTKYEKTCVKKYRLAQKRVILN